MERAAEVVVEVVDVDVPEAAGLVDLPAALERHLVHHPEHVPARGLRQLDAVGVEATEYLGGEPFLEQRVLDDPDDARPDRTQVRDANVGEEDREERPGMDEEQALASVEPDQVRVPVSVARRRLDERGVPDVERVPSRS